jgi:single-stranded-DNA-specific exonuclease
MLNKNIVHRNIPNLNTGKGLLGFPEKIKNILLSRGVTNNSDLDYGLRDLIPPSSLLNTDKASEFIFSAIKNNQSVLIIGDFDADGATSSTLMMKALKSLGAKRINFLVPDRFKFGYGLSVKLVDEAYKQAPDLIITVDNGIANHQGVDRANELGIPVIITDHHLAADTLPNALVIVNPNQPDDDFESKHLAGVGVAFYLMLALRALMRVEHWFEEKKIDEPNFAELLDLVALGTVADVVVLDKNNRILVEQGLKRIRSGQACFGINALLNIAKKQPQKCQASDLGFAIGPRLNAAGRLQNMSIGINCLMATNESEAISIASQLDNLNKQRRSIEQEMLAEANDDLAEYFLQVDEKINIDKADKNKRPTTLCLYDPKWHQGVIGILASRVKDKINRPVIIFAKDDSSNQEPMIKGSARSVTGVHVRDVLALVDSRSPDLIEKFGGHAMAAGLSLKEKDFQCFAQQFHHCTDELLAGKKISDNLETDAGLSNENFTMDFAKQLRATGPWGQGFLEPVFDDEFIVVNQRVVGEKHLKLVLQKGDVMVDGIHFFFDEKLKLQQGDRVHIVYKLDINEFRGNESLQLMIDQVQIVSSS